MQQEITLVNSTFIASREKITLMTKKMVLFIYFNNKLIFDLGGLHKKIGGEIKKFLEVLMIFEKLGFIQKISSTEFMFRGFNGFISTFHGKKED